MCIVQLRDLAELIDTNCMNCEMNFVEEVQTVFYTSRGAALFGQVGCVSLDVGAALTHRFGHLDLEPNDFWTRQVDRGGQRAERDRETAE